MTEQRSIYLLLAGYWQSMHDITVAMNHTDATETGTAEHDAGFAAQATIGERVTETEVAVAGFVPAHRYEARLKTTFLQQLAAANYGRLEDDVTAALLSSLSDLVEWRASA
ncbi:MULTISPECIES: hypothetical protein [unclassified Rhizobium]|uniref:hypothetical protein n=1 Tax=unclassified Rhizobium TaxID=2613769 RepID=UPI0006FA32BD|nr:MULTISPECIES: hypothetical protein [unclassified Rhizobium]KQV39198.1 hypothetical protein ASC86_23305 [Rhizobium sp. Root1212]KRD35172.1 hypothetical protein ASE37_21875 [Rhizobium sp. Root268]